MRRTCNKKDEERNRGKKEKEKKKKGEKIAAGRLSAVRDNWPTWRRRHIRFSLFFFGTRLPRLDSSSTHLSFFRSTKLRARAPRAPLAREHLLFMGKITKHLGRGVSCELRSEYDLTGKKSEENPEDVALLNPLVKVQENPSKPTDKNSELVAQTFRRRRSSESSTKI